MLSLYKLILHVLLNHMSLYDVGTFKFEGPVILGEVSHEIIHMTGQV